MKQINKIKGYENIRDIYYITRDGRLISYASNNLGRSNTPKELKQYEKTGRYLYVALVTNEQKVSYIRVHRLVALAFIPNCNGKPYVNHINEDRQDNRVENLEWVTPSENNRHSLIKKVYQYSYDGELMKIYSSVADVVYDGFNAGHVASCCRNEIRNHKGFIFSYKPLNKTQIVQRLSKPYYLKSIRE